MFSEIIIFSNLEKNGVLSAYMDNGLFGGLIFEGYKLIRKKLDFGDQIFLIDRELRKNTIARKNIYHYSENINLRFCDIKNSGTQWVMIERGDHFAEFDGRVFEMLPFDSSLSVIALNINDSFSGYKEMMKMTTFSSVGGFSRSYKTRLIPCERQRGLPDIFFVRLTDLNAFARKYLGSKIFSETNIEGLESFYTSGKRYDLDTNFGLYGFLINSADSINPFDSDVYKSFHWTRNPFSEISSNARIYGNVYLGKNVRIKDKTTILGPAIIGDNCVIREGTFIENSVISPDTDLTYNTEIRNTLIFPESVNSDTNLSNIRLKSGLDDKAELGFKNWPTFCYQNTLKRIMDIIISSIALLLLSPVFIILSVLIKITSKGPVFFKHKREGQFGKEFNCIKFRTMITGAEELQEKLRIKNEVDGPQFKMAWDPRITFLGRFMRDTFLDEIPQFFNVLKGEMSLIGPRPSPERENTLCPKWRYARLSVKPGITGLWQISRTRRNSGDFQEWIYYDTKYVRDLSFFLDIKILFKTIKKFMSEFFNQFK